MFACSAVLPPPPVTSPYPCYGRETEAAHTTSQSHGWAAATIWVVLATRSISVQPGVILFLIDFLGLAPSVLLSGNHLPPEVLSGLPCRSRLPSVRGTLSDWRAPAALLLHDTLMSAERQGSRHQKLPTKMQKVIESGHLTNQAFSSRPNNPTLAAVLRLGPVVVHVRPSPALFSSDSSLGRGKAGESGNLRWGPAALA